MPVDESSHRSARESCPRCSTLTDYELFGNVTYPLIQNFKCENCSFGWANFYTELGGPLVG